MRQLSLALTSAIEDVSFVGKKVGHPVSSSRGEGTIGEVVPDTTPDCVGGTVVIGDDFVMHSSLLT